MLKVVSMAELRLEVVLEPERTGESVAAVCRRHGISRQTYYRYLARYVSEGMDGLRDRSHRPHRPARQIEAAVEEDICRMRADHPRWGARRIRAELARSGTDPPAISTVHQVLRRNHLVAPQRPRRPKATRRFERPVSGDLWQIDATQTRLVTRRKAWIIDTLDDHARYLLAAIAAPAPTGEAAWACFSAAADRYGLPRQVLSDNGLCFTGRLHGVEVAFERSLAELGVGFINAGPYHPQTLGKLERFHKTLKEWLADEGPAEDLEHLQRLLDAFRRHYNNERPHQGISDLTPAERFVVDAPTTDRPARSPLDPSVPVYPPHAILRRVTTSGNTSFDRKLIHVGKRWSGATVRIIATGGLVHIYHGEELLRVLTLDPDSYYQPNPRKEVMRLRPRVT